MRKGLARFLASKDSYVRTTGGELCVQGRARYGLCVLAKKDPHKLLLKRDEFDAIVKTLHGKVRQWEIANALHLHPSHWSEIRSGKRWFNPAVGNAMVLLPGFPLESYAQPVPEAKS